MRISTMNSRLPITVQTAIDLLKHGTPGKKLFTTTINNFVAIKWNFVTSKTIKKIFFAMCKLKYNVAPLNVWIISNFLRWTLVVATAKAHRKSFHRWLNVIKLFVSTPRRIFPPLWIYDDGFHSIFYSVELRLARVKMQINY